MYITYVVLGALFALFVALSVVVCLSAARARQLAALKYPGHDVAQWPPDGIEHRRAAGQAFVRFFFSTHRLLGDAAIDRLCERVRWSLLAQLTSLTIFLVILHVARR